MRVGAVLAVALLVLGCGGARATGPYVTDARTDPEEMRTDPDVVAPGGELEVTFPQGATRGPGFVLERDGDAGWEWHWAISSDADAPDAVNVFSAAEFVDRDVEWNSGPAFDGTDPHLVPVPRGSDLGRWRVCTVPDTPALCAEFEVSAPGREPPR